MSIGVSVQTTMFAARNNGIGFDSKATRNPTLRLASYVTINARKNSDRLIQTRL
jgi:hypothetical protein